MSDTLVLRSRLMARPMRWERSWWRHFQNGPGTETLPYVTAGVTVGGETYTRIRMDLQHNLHAIGTNDWPWNGAIGAFGIIDSPWGDSAPPGLPLSDQELDWMWREQLVWEGARTTFFDLVENVSHWATAPSRGIDVRAQRLAEPIGGSRLWFVTEWEPGLPASTTIWRMMTISVGILEAP